MKNLEELANDLEYYKSITNDTDVNNILNKLNGKKSMNGLTIFDMYRTPRLPNRYLEDIKTNCNNDYINIEISEIHSELRCPICYEIMKNTVVVMECLHRFCKRCIMKCIQMRRKDCPTCRNHIPSKRSLRNDENFDKLIASIYPNLEEFERKENISLKQVNKSHYINHSLLFPYQLEEENNQFSQQEHRKKHKTDSSFSEVKNNQDIVNKEKNKNISETILSYIDNSNMENDELNFVLHRHPDDLKSPLLEIKSLRSSCTTNVLHLKKFLIKKCMLEHEKEIEIYIKNDKYEDKFKLFILLEDNKNLRYIAETFRPYSMNEDNDIVLFYKIL